jgi:hypothetical protein
MTIKQINASYLINDDRLLFRFNTNEGSEFRFWFTRRVTLFILAATHHLVVKNLEQTHSSEAAKAIAQFGQEEVQSQLIGRNQTSQDVYIPAGTYPLGADPILVIDVKCTMEQQGLEDILSLDLVLPGGANVNLKLAGSVLQGMCILLNQLREHAAWGEVPQVQEANMANDATTESQKPSVH